MPELQKNIETYKLHSKYTRQDYVIVIRKPTHYVSLNNYTLVFIADGSYGVGYYLLDEKNKIIIPENCIVIAINHTGNKEENRDRDFIPSDISRNSKNDFGQADTFYLFIRDELIPFSQQQFPIYQKRVFIGHSLSGLFCLYLALKQEELFDRYYAISPSVWANHFELLKIENEFSFHHSDLPISISIYSGSLEIFNLIRPSVYLFINAISKRNYQNLQLDYTIFKYKGHFSVRKPALDQIMNTLNN